MITIIGLRIEKYIGDVVTGHNCDFEYTPTVLDRHVLLGLTEDKKKVEITLWSEEGECGSGWCTASWGRIEVKKVENFRGYTHKANDTYEIPDINLKDGCYFDDELSNQVFNVNYDGGDGYYPSGYYNVNEELFTPNTRYSEKRTVWIFKGSSASGKSFLADKLTGLSVYETDGCNGNLPDSVQEDIIVVGNKHGFEYEDIISKIFGNAKIVLVDFSVKGGE